MVILYKLFAFRPVLVLIMTIGAMNTVNAQLVDHILGQKRSYVHAVMRPYKIVDYQKDRVVHSFAKDIHQTVLFENDTCTRFYWAVGKGRLDRFRSQLVENGYSLIENGDFVKDSLVLSVRELESGKATMFVASIDVAKLSGNRELSGKKVVDRKAPPQEPLSLLQQAIIAEDKETAKTATKTKKPKDPERHWIGEKTTKTSVLGWELD